MNTLIIEDEGAARRRLEGMIIHHPKLKLEGSAASGHEAIQVIDSSNAELLLMDIQLKDMTAFEVLNAIQKDFPGRIIFITAYNDFAIRAFEVYAVDYLLKPYTKDRLFSAIDRCLSKADRQGEEAYAILESLHFPGKLCIPEGKKSHLFEKDEIDWIEADGYYCKINTSDGETKTIRILLKEIQQLLPEHFIRISRSVILNKNAVATYSERKNETFFQLKNGKAFFGKNGYLGQG